MIGYPLTVTDLHKTYPGNAHPVFDGFSLDVEAGSLCAVVGVSGVGKTTLLNCIAGLDHWEGGRITVGEEPVPEGAEARALYRRRRVGLAFQQPHLLSTVGLGSLGERFPSQLSGGEAARAGLARALVRKPALWLLDEPTGNLDPATAEEVFGFLTSLHAELRPTTLLVTHNPGLAERCMRTVRLG